MSSLQIIWKTNIVGDWFLFPQENVLFFNAASKRNAAFTALKTYHNNSLFQSQDFRNIILACLKTDSIFKQF